MATEVGVNYPAWTTYEKGRSDFSLRVIERVRDITGLDPYNLAYVLYYDYSNLPEPVQECLGKLREVWEDQIEQMHVCKTLLPGQW